MAFYCLFDLSKHFFLGEVVEEHDPTKVLAILSRNDIITAYNQEIV